MSLKDLLLFLLALLFAYVCQTILLWVIDYKNSERFGSTKKDRLRICARDSLFNLVTLGGYITYYRDRVR